MTDVVQCPHISDELITYLDKMFPDAAADPSRKDPAVAYGQATVVRHLKAQRSKQEAVDYVRTET